MFFPIDFLLLYSSPVYHGFGVPRGDGSAAIVIPGFLGSDSTAMTIRRWLRSIGYRPYHSGIGLNAQCPNLLMEDRLANTVRRAAAETGRKVHLIGHSLGGMLAHSLAVQHPDVIASVTTLGSPVRGIVAQRHVFGLARMVRKSILQEHGHRVESGCYTGECQCRFARALNRSTPSSVFRTAIYTCSDGIVDWRYCLTDRAAENFEVSGTHLGLVFNPAAYNVIAHRLHEATRADGTRGHVSRQRSVRSRRNPGFAPVPR